MARVTRADAIIVESTIDAEGVLHLTQEISGTFEDDNGGMNQITPQTVFTDIPLAPPPAPPELSAMRSDPRIRKPL